MLKKILSAILIILQILTQSSGAAEFRQIIQPVAINSIPALSLQISSDILKKENPDSGVGIFSFFRISECFKFGLCRNEASTKDGTDVLLLSVGELAPAQDGAGANFGAYYTDLPALISLNFVRGNPSSDSSPLSSTKDGILLGISDGGFSGNNEAAVTDTRSELTGSNRYLGTNIAVLTSPVPAETRAFTYDPIGNRTNMTVGTTAGTYTANNLNQYTVQTGPANTFTHDFDGNLSQITGTRNVVFTYDGENRLLSVQPVTPVANNKRLEFVYDYQGRRVQKLVYNRSGSSWVLQTTKRFVYDGWNMVEEQTVAVTTKYYVYGLDLSQSLQGAGGVGGLLAKAEGTATHQYFYDANGNISQMINASSGAIDARYEYDAYGNSILATGTQAAGNTMRFSTKYLDTEYNLYYYGYRYYDPATGRWVNRDPSEEAGGLHLYGFVINNPIGLIDHLGLDFIAIGSRKLDMFLAKIPLLNNSMNHMSIEYYQYSGTVNEGDTKIPSNAVMIDAYEILNASKTYGRKVQYSAFGEPHETWEWTPVSFIVHSSTAKRRKIIVSCVTKEWDMIRKTAERYLYAEQGPVGSPLRNWPNSMYRYPWQNPANNSVTFIQALVNNIGKNTDGLEDHPGAKVPGLVLDYGVTPTIR